MAARDRDARALVVAEPRMQRLGPDAPNPTDPDASPYPPRAVRLRSRNPLVLFGGWIMTEVFWALDQFARWFISSLVFLAIKALFGRWYFPEDLWDSAPTYARGFEGARDVSPDAEPIAETEVEVDQHRLTDPPGKEFLFALDEGEGEVHKFYDHQTRRFGQYFPVRCSTPSRALPANGSSRRAATGVRCVPLGPASASGTIHATATTASRSSPRRSPPRFRKGGEGGESAPTHTPEACSATRGGDMPRDARAGAASVTWRISMTHRRTSTNQPTLTVVDASERALAEIWAIAERLVGGEGLDEAYLDPSVDQDPDYPVYGLKDHRVRVDLDREIEPLEALTITGYILFGSVWPKAYRELGIPTDLVRAFYMLRGHFADHRRPHPGGRLAKARVSEASSPPAKPRALASANDFAGIATRPRRTALAAPSRSALPAPADRPALAAPTRPALPAPTERR